MDNELAPEAVTENGNIIYSAESVVEHYDISKAELLFLLFRFGLLYEDESGEFQPTDYANETQLLVRLDHERRENDSRT